MVQAHPGTRQRDVDRQASGRSSRRTSKLDINPEHASHRWRAYLKAMGPGLVTGASDDDPSGIGTYAQAGSQFGFGLLWTALLTFPLMATVQETCDRTALATGAGLVELAARCFTRMWRSVLALLLVALL